MFPTLQSKITAQLSILYTYIQPKETGKEPKQDNTLLFCSKEQPEKKWMHSTIHYSQDMEPTKSSVDKWMNK
jgi:hypothetical protein